MTTAPTFDAIIFDMDGLLVDSEKVWHRAETELLANYGYTYDEAFRNSIIGLRMDQFLHKLKATYDLEPSVEALHDELVNRMLALIPEETQPQPGAHAIVDYVAKHDISHAIASSSPMVIIDAILRSQGWDSLFALRCSADDDANGKPAPDVYLRAAQEVGVEPGRCLALEDSANGARAAVAAGMTCYAVPDATHTDAAAFEAITPFVYDSLHDVLETLQA